MKETPTRLPLHFNAQEIGSVRADVLSRLKPAVSKDVQWLQDQDVWHLQGPADVAFDEFARALRQAGLCPHWRDELLSVSNKAGHVVGAIERGATRILGIRTQAVHLLGQSATGYWLQQRAMSKSDDPGLWDTLSGGMVSHGETIAQTLERETFEEAGLRLADLEHICYRGVLNIMESTDQGMGLRCEELHYYTANLPTALEPSNQDGEVIGFECVSQAKLLKMLAEGALTADAIKIFQLALGLAQI
jgi:8-oxo-dGTP pyrophosphatase MutT (NUDIX family)